MLNVISTVAVVITAVIAVVGVGFGIYRYSADSKTDLEIHLNRAGRSSDQAIQGQMVSIRVVNHSKFATTIRAIHIKKNDGTSLQVHEKYGAHWPSSFSGTPARLESREEINAIVPSLLFEDATHVNVTTVDGHTESVVAQVYP